MSLVLVLVMSLFAGKALVTASWPVCDLFDKNVYSPARLRELAQCSSEMLEFRVACVF